jgi:hypothetical protein
MLYGIYGTYIVLLELQENKNSKIGVTMSTDYRVLVCGGRDFDDAEKLVDKLDTIKKESTPDGKKFVLIHGDARGADYLANSWAEFHKLKIKKFPANWKKFGKAAGHIRNAQMLEEGSPDLVVAFPGGRGTENMIQQAKKYGVPVIKIA